MYAPTPEQADIIAAARSGGNLTITAAAGTGKTATLQFLAADRPQVRGLYVAFNKAIQLEAEQKFAGSRIEARTMHSLAFATHGRPRQERLRGPRYVPWGVKAKALGVDQPFYAKLGAEADKPQKVVQRNVLIRLADDLVKRYLMSDAVHLDDVPFVVPGGLLLAKPESIAELERLVRDIADAIWDDLMRPDGKLPFSHDVYLKTWSLDPDASRLQYDLVMLDEAQDASNTMVSVLQRQQQYGTQLVAVGDAQQAIYGWRGAVDAMNAFDGQRFPLMQSFRFGPGIAARANWWLRELGAEFDVVGLQGKPSHVGHVPVADAVLCRSNGGVLAEVMSAQERGTVTHIAGKHQAEALRKLAKACEELQERGKTQHPDLDSFSSWDEVRHHVEIGDAPELEPLVKLVDKYEPRDMIRAIDDCVDDPGDAELNVSTMHVSKGLEWERVRIAHDFRQPPSGIDGEAQPIPAEQARLAYVAVTRARTELDDSAMDWARSWEPGVEAPDSEPVPTPALDLDARRPRSGASRRRNTPSAPPARSDLGMDALAETLRLARGARR